MFRDSLRTSFAHIGIALREPEAFAVRWQKKSSDYQIVVWVALALTAIVGTMTYGLTMGIGEGAGSIARKAVLLTTAAGLAWAIPLPALYVLHSLGGSRLSASTTFLAALVTTSWGGLALVASVPINWFFSVAVPAQVGKLLSQSTAHFLVLGVNLLVFAGVGISMADVFRRVMQALEPTNEYQPLWFLALVGIIGSDLMYLFNLFAW